MKQVKELVVISGKGGTGKTSIVGSFAALAENAVLADCDVDAADLHLILKPSTSESHDFYGMKKAYINREKCVECGECEKLCNFKAIRDFKVIGIACEGCGVCFHACAAGAVEMREHLAGNFFVSETRYGPMVHAKLGIAEANSGLLVSKVKEYANNIARENGRKLILVDGPPGIGCPVIASLGNADAVLLVAEPTLSGIHDLKRVIKLAEHFGIKPLVLINKFDINKYNAQQIEEFCREQNIEMLGKLPYDEIFTKAQVHGLPVVEYAGADNETVREIKALWQNVLKVMA